MAVRVGWRVSKFARKISKFGDEQILARVKQPTQEMLGTGT